MSTSPIYLLTFIFLIILQIFLSKALTKRLSLLLHRLTGSRNWTINLLSFIFLPGTLIHELSHILMAKALFVETGDIDLFPEKDGEEAVKLGSAEIARTDPVRRSLIGIAPIILGISLIIALVYIFGSWLSVTSPDFSIWKALLLLFVIFELSNTFNSSKPDLEGTLAVVFTITVVFLIVFALLLILNIATLQTFLGILSTVYTPEINSLFKLATLGIVLPVALNLSLLGLLSLTVYWSRKSH